MGEDRTPGSRPERNRGNVWLNVRRNDTATAREQLREFPTAVLYEWRRDATRLIELITDVLEERTERR
jgi:hypothetical protein